MIVVTLHAGPARRRVLLHGAVEFLRVGE